ncbi:PAS domain-containing protein, partial [Frankia sp. CcWB3]
MLLPLPFAPVVVLSHTWTQIHPPESPTVTGGSGPGRTGPDMNPTPQPDGQVRGDTCGPWLGWPAPRALARWEDALLCLQVFDTAPIIFAVLDRGLRYRAVNQAAARASGLPAEEMIGGYGPE